MIASAGVTPNVMGLAPVPGTEEALAKAGWSIDDLDVRDSPGFASSRLGVLLGLEVIRMLEEGAAYA